MFQYNCLVNEDNANDDGNEHMTNSEYETEPFIFQNNDDIQFVPAVLPREPQNFMDEYDDNDEILTKDSEQELEPPPTDVGNMVYTIFYMLGMSTMIPWNFFITAEDYWMYKFRNTTVNGSNEEITILTPLQKSFASDLTLTASIAGTIFLIVHAIYGQQVALRIKVLGSLVLILIMFALTTTFVEIDTDKWQEQFFVITLITVIILNVVSAILSGAVFGMAGLLPSVYMTAIVSGQALAGILTALIFLVILTCETDPNITAFVYFIFGSILIIINIICYAQMERLSFFRYYIKNTNRAIISSNTIQAIQTKVNILNVLAKIYTPAVTIFLLFTTTLSVYPAVTVLMQSEYYGLGYAWNDIYYMPVINYLIFNCGDYFGRVLAGIFEQYTDNCETILLTVLLRVIYVPLFLCCNSNVHQFLPIIIHSDIIFILMIITFALSNGYLANMLFTMVPRYVKHEEREIASSLMIAFLSCGLAFGSMLSMSFVHML